ncbi:hypothetical protein DFH28DRAFT_1127555 [Melampsora americana]|nr:hypothetical protein DFH28DRAFT_1127555 [Melampsora americana]
MNSTSTLLPIFNGHLHDSWDLHQLKLISWFKTQNISDQDDQIKLDYLILSLQSNSNALNWYSSQPIELRSSFIQSLTLLKNKFGNDLRKEIIRLSALNSLEVRTFRDPEHKTEMVYQLVDELDHLLSLGAVHHDNIKRDYLLRCFRAFAGAIKLINRSTSYDGAVLAALNWESSVISKAQEAMIQASLDSNATQKQIKSRRNKHHSQIDYLLQAHERHGAINLTPDHQPKVVNSESPKRFVPSPELNQHHPVLPQSSIPQLHQNKEQECDTLALDDQNSSDLKGPSRHPPDPRKFRSESNLQPKPNSNPSDYKGKAPLTNGSGSDPMVESFVDPLMMSDRTRPNYNQVNNRPLELNSIPQDRYPDYHYQPNHDQHQPEASTSYHFKPIVYNPEINPYPPPTSPINQQNVKQLSNDEHEMQNSKPVKLPEPDTRAWVQAQEEEQQKSNRNHHPYNQLSSQAAHPVYPNAQSGAIPFPSPRIPSQAAEGDGVPISQFQERISRNSFTPQSFVDPRRDNQPVGYPSNSHISLESASYPHHRTDFEKFNRRPSKLIKNRPKTSGSSNASSKRSVGSLKKVKSFLSALQANTSRRGSKDSVTSRAGGGAGGSESTQEFTGPRTPSSAAEELTLQPTKPKLRPMQAQFNRLFRKHNHPEGLRRQQRSMLIDRNRPESQQPIKGKGRSLDFGKSHEPTSARPMIIGMGKDDPELTFKQNRDPRQNHSTGNLNQPAPRGFGQHRAQLNQVKGIVSKGAGFW